MHKVLIALATIVPVMAIETPSRSLAAVPSTVEVSIEPTSNYAACATAADPGQPTRSFNISFATAGVQHVPILGMNVLPAASSDVGNPAKTCNDGGLTPDVGAVTFVLTGKDTAGGPPFAFLVACETLPGLGLVCDGPTHMSLPG